MSTTLAFFKAKYQNPAPGVYNNDWDTFYPKLVKICNELATFPELLLAVMYAESGLNPAIENTSAPFYVNGKLDGYATGLIQFIPSTARGLKTTTWALKTMSGTQQLDYVRQYYYGYRGRIDTLYGLYMATFMPAHLKDLGNDALIIGTGTGISPKEIRRMNPALDSYYGNNDGVISIGEFKNYIRNKFKQFPDLFDKKKAS